jgi:hypothetical protein
LGDCTTHTRLAGEWLRDAQDRGDKVTYTSLMVLGAAFHRLAIVHSLEEAEAAVDGCMRGWPTQTFCTQHLGHIISKTNVMRMRRDPGVHDFMEGRWPQVASSLLSRSDFTLAALLPIRAHLRDRRLLRRHPS